MPLALEFLHSNSMEIILLYIILHAAVCVKKSSTSNSNYMNWSLSKYPKFRQKAWFHTTSRDFLHINCFLLL